MVKTKKTELLFLARFLRLFKPAGRAAVTVPDGVLFGSSNAHKTLRQILVEEQNLDAVVSLPSGVFRPYAGVSTAIFRMPTRKPRRMGQADVVVAQRRASPPSSHSANTSNEKSVPFPQRYSE